MALEGGFKQPKDDARFSWTAHAAQKMRQYGLSESRIRRIIRHPTRTEEGIAPETVAVMQPGGTTRYHEIWVMYSLKKQKGGVKVSHAQKRVGPFAAFERPGGKIKVITAWRYPGKSPERNPVPQEILDEVTALL
jgi:hypothetical protein